jgi:hypothetical protein
LYKISGISVVTVSLEQINFVFQISPSFSLKVCLFHFFRSDYHHLFALDSTTTAVLTSLETAIRA